MERTTQGLLHEPLLPAPGGEDGESNVVRRAQSTVSDRFGFDAEDVQDGDEVIRRFQLQTYRLNTTGAAVATKPRRQGKYTGQVYHTNAPNGMRPVPHGMGTFKTTTGYAWTGLWSDGVPNDDNGNETLDGLPTAEDSMLGGDFRGHWDNGKPVVYTRERTLEKRLKDGDYEQAMSMMKVGLHGLNAMLPGHPMNKPISPVIFTLMFVFITIVIYWAAKVSIDWSSKDVVFPPMMLLMVCIIYYCPKFAWEGQQHRIWDCFDSYSTIYLLTSAGHIYIAAVLFSGEFTEFNTGLLTLPFGVVQIAGVVTSAVHSIGALYGVPASYLMVRYELLRQKHEAIGLPFPETVYWWSDSAALGSPFITIFECPMSAAERAGLYLWYFVFGFGTFGMWLFLELHGPVDQRFDAEAESRLSAYRFRWCLLVTGIGGIMLFFASCINLDKDLKRKYPLTKNMVGIISFVLMACPILAITTSTLFIFSLTNYTLEDMWSIATGQINVAMFSLVIQWFQLHIEAREAKKTASNLVAEDAARYDACWESVRAADTSAGNRTLERIRALCNRAKQASLDRKAYTDDPLQDLSGVDPDIKAPRYAVLLKLLQLAIDLNPIVQDSGRRWCREGGASAEDFKEAPVKTAKRAIEKVWRSYNGKPACLTDVVRTSMVCVSLEQMEGVASAIFADPTVQVIRVKNRFDPDYNAVATAGYRDISMNLKLTSTDSEYAEVIFEVQIQHEAFYALKSDKGHAKYAQFRDLRGA